MSVKMVSPSEPRLPNGPLALPWAGCVCKGARACATVSVPLKDTLALATITAIFSIRSLEREGIFMRCEESLHFFEGSHLFPKTPMLHLWCPISTKEADQLSSIVLIYRNSEVSLCWNLHWVHGCLGSRLGWPFSVGSESCPCGDVGTLGSSLLLYRWE